MAFAAALSSMSRWSAAIGVKLVLDVAAATPSGSTKLGTATGTPVDTFAQDAATGGMADLVFDPDAIHDNVAAEVSVLTEKATPVAGDHLLIEDSAAGNAKKRAQIGSLPSSAVAKAYLHARMNSQSTDLLAGDHVEFDDQLIVDASGDISLAVGAGQLAGLITLAAGKVYEVTTGIRADFSAAGGVVRFRLRDNTGAVEFGNQSELFVRTGTSQVESLAIATGIIAPTVITEIELRITVAVSLLTIQGLSSAAGQSYVKVVEIG